MIIQTKVNNIERNNLLELNTCIHKHTERYQFHMKHIQLVEKYAILINKKLGNKLNNNKLSYIALAHDLLKLKGKSVDTLPLSWNNHIIPNDLTKYVRSNLDVLEQFGLDDYFNTGVQYHSLAAGIFLFKELNITDLEILYPVMFHSCPIMDIYKTLQPRIRRMIDVIMLSDKLSSNYLKINFREVAVPVDLDLIVFGPSGLEFNYTLGLYIAKALGRGKTNEEQTVASIEFYFNRLCKAYPIISKKYVQEVLGEKRKWPKRMSQALKMH